MMINPTTQKTLLTLSIASVLGATSAQSLEPKNRPDGSYISISGTVAAPTDDEFVLDYGSGNILVEMDDWDSYGEAHGLMDGDRVTVLGRVDDDLFEVASIEAGSVYVENLNAYFYASSNDEESFYPRYWGSAAPVIISAATLMGDVVSVDAAADKFTIDTGMRQITVETERLNYDPLDNRGYQQIDVGDYVSVSGMMNFELLDGQVFEAEQVTTLIDEKRS